MLESLKREKSQRRCMWSQVERQLGNTLTRTLNTTGAPKHDSVFFESRHSMPLPSDCLSVTSLLSSLVGESDGGTLLSQAEYDKLRAKAAEVRHSTEAPTSKSTDTHPLSPLSLEMGDLYGWGLSDLVDGQKRSMRYSEPAELSGLQEVPALIPGISDVSFGE